jgi:hypothetical protein
VEVAPDVAIVPFVSFEFNSYWDAHYRDRPFYRERDRYASININVNITGGKSGVGHHDDGKEAGRVSGAAAAGGQVTGGGKPPNGGEGKGKIVTKSDNKVVTHNKTIVTKADKGAGAGTMSAKSGTVAKKGGTPPAVKKGCKPDENGCSKS